MANGEKAIMEILDVAKEKNLPLLLDLAKHGLKEIKNLKGENEKMHALLLVIVEWEMGSGYRPPHSINPGIKEAYLFLEGLPPSEKK